MRFSLVAGLVAPCCLLAACGGSSPTFGSLQGKSPSEVLSLATSAITATDSSFHFVDVSRVGSKTTTLTGDDTAAGADQELSGAVSALEVERRSDGSLFVRGAAPALQSALGLSATAASTGAATWISLQPGDGPYTSVSVSLDPQKELTSFVPTGTLQLLAPRQFHGRTVVGVTGAARTTGSTSSGHVATIYVPTEAPYTPVGATLTFGSGSSQGIEAVVFSRWGKRFNPPSPTRSIAYSSLLG